MPVTAGEARKSRLRLVKKVNEGHDAVEMASMHGKAVLVSADDFAALCEGAYLLCSPANARRLLTSYANAVKDAPAAVKAQTRPGSEP